MASSEVAPKVLGEVEAVLPSERPRDIAPPEVEKGAECSKEEVWPLWKLTLLALPQVGVQVMWCFLGPNSAPYMKHLGASNSLATLNNTAGPVVGFITGPLVGAWSDRSTNRWGRRRPIIVGGLVSTIVAGFFWSASTLLLPEGSAIWLSAPMYWVLDVTINVLQTPFRALVSDCASDSQQLPMQVVFVFMMAIGNFVGYSMMQIYTEPTAHMFELMMMICGINVVCVGIQSLVAKEKQHVQSTADDSKRSCCGPVMSSFGSVKGQPKVFYVLIAVQCLIWFEINSWNGYGQQWFTSSVYEGDQQAPQGSEAQIHFAEGVAAFATAGQLRSGVQLVLSLSIMALLLYTTIPHRFLYAPMLYVGAAISFLASFAVQHSGAFAMFCMVVSMVPEAATFAIPYGLVAIWNKSAEEQGRPASTAMQMALLNCCITVGQQLNTLVLALLETSLDLSHSLIVMFVIAGVAAAIAGTGALFLKDVEDSKEKSQDVGVDSEASEAQDIEADGEVVKVREVDVGTVSV